jgi:DNA adenine methylase
MIDRVDHDGYAEPLAGMVGVFLRLRQRPKVEVINNSSGDVATFFRVLQRHYPYMIDILRFRIASRAEFERLKAQRPETLTDLERATRFLYLQKLAFGGKVAERGFGVDKSQGVRFNICRLGPELRSRRLGVASRPGVLGLRVGLRQDRFGRTDFELLPDQRVNIKAQFVLSINEIAGARG